MTKRNKDNEDMVIMAMWFIAWVFIISAVVTISSGKVIQ